MTARSYIRGHSVFYNSMIKAWFYEDTGESADIDNLRPCKKCGKMFIGSGIGESDPCIGDLPGVDNACCGHGIPEQAYIRFTNGVVIKGFNKIEYTERWKEIKMEQPSFEKLLSAFEAAAQELSWKGSKMPEEWPEIEEDYLNAKRALTDYVEKLECHMASTVGFWATDKKEIVIGPRKWEDLFFQIESPFEKKDDMREAGLRGAEVGRKLNEALKKKFGSNLKK